MSARIETYKELPDRRIGEFLEQCARSAMNAGIGEDYHPLTQLCYGLAEQVLELKSEVETLRAKLDAAP